ncbi:unnamed protein product [Trichogramma brassicae]|uniref:Uncharacterized protein n=1 Tax=Trichogramma brassicae TaxID=86971 RepID=A0A6H5J5L6_9HYME|nr:unnamed protein product [Trichogramma brassicae]
MFISGAPRRRCGAIPLYYIRYRIEFSYYIYEFGGKSNIVCRISRASTSMILRSKHLRTRSRNCSRVFSLLREYRNNYDLSTDGTIICQRRHRKGIMIGEAPLCVEASDLVCDAFHNIYKCVCISLHTYRHGLSGIYSAPPPHPPQQTAHFREGKLMKKNCLNGSRLWRAKRGVDERVCIYTTPYAHTHTHI